MTFPTIDFETYSEAGYVWDASLSKWGALPGAPSGKKGLSVVGAAVYATHPSTEVLCLAYALPDGITRLWTPRHLPPVALLRYVQAGGLVEAWNSSFEHWIWNHVCVPRYGWPPLPLRQLQCSMARARAHALPGSLEKAGEVVGAAQQKSPEGKRLLRKFSMPRQPTKNDPRTRIPPVPSDPDTDALYQYCAQDIAAEACVSELCPPIEGEELEYWRCDQAINYRGVAIDLAGVENCIAVIDEAHAAGNARLYELTGGAVSRASEVSRLTAWLHGQGAHMDSLDEEHVTEMLKQVIPPAARESLTIRAAIGSAAVKKTYAMHNQCAPDGRLHNLFSYHAARTGRATGNGPQPTNLPNSGPEVFRCECGRHYGRTLPACPWCGRPPASGPVEWNAAATEDALEVIATRSLDALLYFFGEGLPVISACLRGLFVSASGHDLICSDYSSIEAVVLAEIAGETWRREVFQTHGRIYEISAAKITGIPFDEAVRHPRRKLGKVAELACFTRDTQVLTSRGYVRIVDVLTTDMLWDGVEWVHHEGVIPKGKRDVITLDGVRMTPTHPISIGRSWREASELASNENTLALALEIGSENLPSNVLNLATPGVLKRFGRDALAGLSILCRSLTCGEGERLDATPAPRKRPPEESSTTGATLTYSQTINTVGDYLTVSLPASGVVLVLPTPGSRTTGGVELPFGGGKTSGRFSPTLSRLKGGICRIWSWIERTLTGGTNRETCGSSRNDKTKGTDDQFRSFRNELKNSKPVFDIMNSGSRNRFTIKTESGHLIVHNSGYQGWIGGWKAFGADEFLSDEEIKQAILAWRAASPGIVELWGGQGRDWRPERYGCEGMAIQAIQYPCTPHHVLRQDGSYTGVSFQAQGDVLYCRLPSGRALTYHHPRLRESERRPGTLAISYEGQNTNPKNGPVGWIRMDTWGGRLVENIVQGTARDILRRATINLEAAGYPIVLHVYDEIVAEVPEGFGSIAEFEQIMGTMPEFAADWPVRAQGGWRGKRYRK